VEENYGCFSNESLGEPWKKRLWATLGFPAGRSGVRVKRVKGRMGGKS